jgi:putative transposase
VEQAFRPASIESRLKAPLGAEVTVTIPHRGDTSKSTYFITASTYQKKQILQSQRMAELFLETLFGYRDNQKFLVHEYVVMPDHFHVLITPVQDTLERCVQLMKGGFSFKAKKQLHVSSEIWQTSFYDRRVRDWDEYLGLREYIHQNPVKRGLVDAAEEWDFSSALPFRRLDDVPQRLKPTDLSS